MWPYVICGVIWIVVMVPPIRCRLTNEVYAHCALSILLTMLTLGLSGIGAILG